LIKNNKIKYYLFEKFQQKNKLLSMQLLIILQLNFFSNIP
jgi:hypothetical protein